jgi:hypothetical protein
MSVFALFAMAWLLNGQDDGLRIELRTERLEQVRRQIELDLQAGLASCETLTGRPRLACEARAVATARAPQGRLGRAGPGDDEAEDGS